MKHLHPSGRHSEQASLLGALLKEKREALGVSQAQLATRLGVSRPYLSRLERGEYEHPSPQVLVRIAGHLDVRLADLYALAGHTPSTDLPNYVAYLHAKHPDLPDEAVRELADYYEFIKQKHSVQ